MLIVLSVGSLPEEQPDLQSPPQSIFAAQAHAEALFLQESADHHPQEPAPFPGWVKDPWKSHQEGGGRNLLGLGQHELHRSELLLIDFQRRSPPAWCSLWM